MFLEFDVQRKSFLISGSSNKMIVSFRSIACLFLATLLVFAAFERCEAIRWTKRPANPTIFVEGFNNTEKDSKLPELVWDFDPEGAPVESVVIQRTKPGEAVPTSLAVRRSNSAFSFYKDEYLTEYGATGRGTLQLKSVNNDEEYTYIFVVSYEVNNLPTPFTDSVKVVVYVPPKITKVEPNKRSVVNPRESKNLTCEASGDPKPNITWTREGFTKAQFNASGNQLHLVNITRKDIGGYKCTADNGFGTATGLFFINIFCPRDCKDVRVGMRITGPDNWNVKLRDKVSPEFKALETKLTSAIADPYNHLPENNARKLYQLFVEEFTSGSISAIVKMQFQDGNNDTEALLKPLRDDMSDGRLGPFAVDSQLVVDPTTPPSTSPSGQTPTPTKGDADTGARGSTGLSDGALAGIIAGCAAFVIVIIIIIIVCCIKKRKQAGASKSKYTEADGYRMNRQPPPSGLGTASPAYVEARMYAPANATKKQDDQPKPLNYADLSFDKSGKPPPRYGSGTEYSEMSPEKRPPPAGGQGGGGGGGQGEGGFELWC